MAGTAGQDTLVRLGMRAWAVLGILLVLVAVYLAAAEVSLLLSSFVVALFPAALFSPLASRLRQTRVPDSLTALLLVLLLVLAFVLPAWYIVPRFAKQMSALGDAIMQGLDEAQQAVDWSALPGSPQGPRDLVERLFEGDGGGGALAQGMAALTTAANTLAGLVLVLVILFFCLKDGRRLWQGVLDLLPRRRQGEVDLLARRSWWTLGAYLRGQLLVATVDAVFIGLGLWLLGIPLVLPLSVLVFFGALFPIVGSFVAGTLAVLVGLADGGLVTALLVLALIVVVQQVEGNVLQPIIMSNIVALHPLVVILVVLVGGILLGVLGAFIAVPVAAIIARIVEHLRGRPPAAGPTAETA
jgi:predicted PurR-regulated permease PerM